MKPALIVLTLIGLLFFAVLAGTRSNAANKAPGDQEGRMKLAHTLRPPGVVKLVGSALGRWAPKVKFAQTAYTVATGTIEVPVPSLNDTVPRVPGAPQGPTFRLATIRVAPPHCASVSIKYDATGEEGAAQGLAHQTWSGSEAEPCVGLFVVRPNGGNLTITCPPLQTCSLTFE